MHNFVCDSNEFHRRERRMRRALTLLSSTNNNNNNKKLICRRRWACFMGFRDIRIVGDIAKIAKQKANVILCNFICACITFFSAPLFFLFCSSMGFFSFSTSLHMYAISTYMRPSYTYHRLLIIRYFHWGTWHSHSRLITHQMEKENNMSSAWVSRWGKRVQRWWYGNKNQINAQSSSGN